MDKENQGTQPSSVLITTVLQVFLPKQEVVQSADDCDTIVAWVYQLQGEHVLG
jgi:hypothetical protein